MLRYLWTVQGDDHDFAAGDRHGIGGYFLPMFDQPVHQRIGNAAAGWCMCRR